MHVVVLSSYIERNTKQFRSKGEVIDLVEDERLEELMAKKLIGPAKEKKIVANAPRKRKFARK